MKKSHCIIISCLFLFTGALPAVERSWFEIEIIMFEQANDLRLSSENWLQTNAPVDTDNGLDFITPDPSEVKLTQVCVEGNLVEVTNFLEVIEIDELDETLEMPPLNQQPQESTTTESTFTNEITELVEDNFVEEKPYQILDKEFNQLNELYSTLKRRRGYRPLLHLTWRQPVENQKKSQSIRLFAGSNFSENFNPDGKARIDIATLTESDEIHQDTKAQFDFPRDDFSRESSLIDNNSPFALTYSEDYSLIENAGLSQTELNQLFEKELLSCENQHHEIASAKRQDVWQLDGLIKIYVERYLHLETDLFLRIPGKEEIQLGALQTSLAADKLINSLDMEQQQNNTEFGWQLDDNFLQNDQNTSTITQDILNHYPMRQSRRIRSNELHYIDHPLFGLIVQIRPYENNKAESDT